MDIDKLKALALAATNNNQPIIKWRDAISAFREGIKEVHPATVLELIAEIEKLRNQLALVSPPFAAPASQHEAIMGAIGRGYCAHTNSHKAVDFELVRAMTEEVEKELASRCRAQGGNTNEKGEA